MKALGYMRQKISQAEFAAWVAISEARVSQLMSEGVLRVGDTGHEWLVAYHERLRDVAAGRASADGGGLDLVQERAALARSQRLAQELKNDVARREFVPAGLVVDVFGMAAGGAADRVEQVDSMLRKSCPDVSDEVRAVVQQSMVNARNEWERALLKAITELVEGKVVSLGDDEFADDSPEDSD